MRAISLEWLGRVWRYLIGLVVLTVALAMLSHFVVPAAIAPYAVGVVVASGGWAGFVLWLDSSGTANLRAGIDGEQFAISELRPLLRRGWRLVNHLMLEHRDVDHVLIGPGGCFAIETKFRSRWRLVPDDELTTWARQAARNAREVHNRAGRLQAVTPIVVMWGPHVLDLVPTPSKRNGVTVCAGTDLVAVVTTNGADLDQPAIDGVHDALDEYVTKRTIGEERDFGPRPRAIGDHIFDLLLGVLVGFLSVLAVAYATRIDPPIVSFPLACIALLAVAALVRRRSQHPTVRAMTAGIIAAAVAQLVLAIVVVAIAVITS